MSLTFEYIHAKNLRSVWPFVKQGLERILTKGTVSWIPEDVYATIRIGKAFLYIAKEPTRVVGFFIVERIEEPFTYEPILNVWCAYAVGEEGENYADALDYEPQVNAEIDRLARTINTTRVRWSGRPGWARTFKAALTAKSTQYEREVAPLT